MAIHTAAETIVNVDQETAFAVVSSPQRLASCIPGCSNLVQLAPDLFTATLSSKVSFMSVSFKVAIEVVRMDPPTAIEARITGDALGGLAGHVVASATVLLSDAGGGKTAIKYATEVGLTGKLGGLGQPVFKATSAKIAREFGENLKREIERPEPGAAA
jgi:carbon monoxide dehydrogenase subunit G